MATYVLLLNFTEQGIKGVKSTVDRAQAFQAAAQKAGAQVKALYWTLGQYDLVTIVEAPDDETMTALALGTAALGNVRTETLRAVDAEAMRRIIGKMP